MTLRHTGAMDINEYAMEYLVRERLSSLRAAAARQTLSLSAAPSPGLRLRLADTLIHAGQWLRASAAESAHSQPTHG
jgi:hypothetical protein